MIILLVVSCKKDGKNSVSKNGLFFQMVKSKDSGYILKKKGLDFMLAASLTDTLNSYWNQTKETDTLGKYYFNKNTNSYFACVVDLSGKYSFETHLLLEVDSNGKIIKKERFLHGNYSCCWFNYYEGFSKRGDYFCLKTCGTGSGYCASYLYLFKEILPQESQNPIPQGYWSSAGIAQNLTSKLDIRNDELIMHYKLESGVVNDSLDFEINETKTFDAKYRFKNKKWVTKDQSKYDGLDLDL